MEFPFHNILHSSHEFSAAAMNSFSVLSESNSGGSSCMSNAEAISQENSSTPDVTALKRLSENLESVFGTSEFSDAAIVASDGREIPIHRFILSGRSVFFKNLLSKPEIIASIITKGARTSDAAPGGRNALQILKRLTKLVDYQRCIQRGKDAPKDRLCIEILEQAETKAPLVGDASFSLATAGEDHRQKWSDLENRVAMARLLFPKEAQVAMHIAKVDGTKEFPLTANCGALPGHRIAFSNLNEAPFVMEDAHLQRIIALTKTVEFGRRFFPRCSEALDKIVDDEDLIDLANFGNDIDPKRQLRKRRYQEFLEEFKTTFSQDKEEFEKSRASSSTKGLSRTNAKMKSRNRT
ncbi:hypothetical protein MKW94_026177 [Papaver nudicaule]|uniref:BTB domain-containing protein n=1 Tax=Papaver nudicaule TaxID=74823 RepID=A0AA41W051_PAPNU|nr:hypothetical protein [Papaver nudicaule]